MFQIVIAMFTTTLFGLPDGPVMAHVSLFGLVSVVIAGGAYSVDRWLAEQFGTTGATGRIGTESTPMAD